MDGVTPPSDEDVALLVLGITDGIASSAAIVRDGRIFPAFNKERLSRIKMVYSFPRRSIAAALNQAGMTPDAIGTATVDTEKDYSYDGLRPFDEWFRSR